MALVHTGCTAACSSAQACMHCRLATDMPADMPPERVKAATGTTEPDLTTHERLPEPAAQLDSSLPARRACRAHLADRGCPWDLFSGYEDLPAVRCQHKEGHVRCAAPCNRGITTTGRSSSAIAAGVHIGVCQPQHPGACLQISLHACTEL